MEPEAEAGMEPEWDRRRVDIKLLSETDLRTGLATIVSLAKTISFAILPDSPPVSISLSLASLIGGTPTIM